MTDRKPLQYELAGGQSVFKAFAHSDGRTNRAWLAVNFFHFKPEGKEYFLLTSPFIEPIGAKISWHFGASAGRADARRRDAVDVVTSSRSGNAADARPPPRPVGLLAHGPAISHLAFSKDSQAWETAAKC
jgi:hypothetical protein